jgi:protein SCO1/2
VSPAPPREAIPLRRALLWGLLVAALLAVGVAAAWSRWGVRREPPPILSQVPPFALVNRDGRTVTAADLAGAPWIADFVFTRCAASCPLMTERMAKLAKELDLGASGDRGDRQAGPIGGPRLRFVSFTVDPDHDTPAVLTAYAARYRAPPAWLFLTGPQSTLHKLSREGFKLAVEPAGGPEKEPILHSTRFVLVDARGRIRGYYDGFDAEAMAKLERDLAALAS